ncbi:MAG: transcriptional repressor [Candidatus Marinimicrobia bacterium]|nr:transcriptional repressor [Candidatus Neomarinimicrobiota bacterium]
MKRIKIDPDRVEVRLDYLKTVCRQANMRVTHQRLEIFREVAMTGDHPNAEQVFKGVRQRLSTISLDTVYRTLWMLVDLGLITTMAPGRRRARFDANLDQHHHFVCNQCGLTRDFYSSEYDQLTPPEMINTYGYAQKTQVEVLGLCYECSKNESK